MTHAGNRAPNSCATSPSRRRGIGSSSRRACSASGASIAAIRRRNVRSSAPRYGVCRGALRPVRHQRSAGNREIAGAGERSVRAAAHARSEGDVLAGIGAAVETRGPPRRGGPARPCWRQVWIGLASGWSASATKTAPIQGLVSRIRRMARAAAVFHTRSWPLPRCEQGTRPWPRRILDCDGWSEVGTGAPDR